MVADAVRAVVVVFAATLNVTVPEPVRPVPFWNVRKGLALVALHAQPGCVVTVTTPVLAVSLTLVVAGVIE
jgi:hypothetical protein